MFNETYKPNRTNFTWCLPFCIVGISFLFSSCVTQQKIEYVQNKDHQSKEFTNSPFHDYTLKLNDKLYIQISSLDDAQSTISATTQSNQYMSSINPYGASLMSHTVNKDGYVDLPVIGKVLVKDKTVDEVTAMLKEALKNVLNLPIISVKLVNSYISILGEVRNPGRFVYAEDKLTLFDALAMAGDITDYGDRKALIHVRNINGKTIRTEVDLTKSDIASSEFFFLQPNDMIYIKPMRNKFWGLRQFPFAIVLSSITTAILVLNYVK